MVDYPSLLEMECLEECFFPILTARLLSVGRNDALAFSLLIFKSVNECVRCILMQMNSSELI